MIVAIPARSLFPVLVTIENSTSLPALSNNSPFLFQENPLDCRSFRDFSTDRAGRGTFRSSQSLLPGVTCVQIGVALPSYTRRAIFSRSIAAEIARRKFTSWNHDCFFRTSGKLRFERSLRLKNRKLYSSPGPASRSFRDFSACAERV